MSMRGLVLGVLLIVGTAGAAVLAPRVLGQTPGDRERAESRGFQLPFDGGSQIGASVRDLDEADVTREKLATPRGAVVESLDPDGPAGRAGLKAGDIVVEFDGEAVRSARHLTRLVRESPAGRTVTATVVRGGTRTALELTPVSRPAFGLDGQAYRESMRSLEELGRTIDLESMMGLSGGRGRLGVTVQPLTPQLAAYFGVKDGLLITSVRDESPAAAGGLKAGDVITTVNGTSVTTQSDLVHVLRSAGENTDAAIELMRERKTVSATVKLERPEMRRRMARGREL